VLAVVGLWVTRFLLSRLGQHDYGLWLVATQLLAYLSLTDLGIVALLPREVAYATGRAAGGHASQLTEVVSDTAGIVFLQLPLVAAAAGGLWLFLPADWEPLRGPLAALMVAFFATFPFRLFPATLSGLQDLAFLGALQTGALLAGTAATVILALADWGLYSVVAGWIVTQLIVGAGALLRLRIRYREVLPRSLPKLHGQQLWERLGRGFWVALSQIAVVLLNATDVVIIGKALGAAAVVPYMCTGKLIGFLGNQSQLLMQTAQPGLAELRASESRPRVLLAATALTQGVLVASGAIACVVMAVNYGFVRLWVGEAQWGGLALTLVILLRTLGAHWNLATGTAIFAFGHERRLALVGIADSVVFVVLSSWLVRRLGPLGAPAAALVTLLAISLPFNLSALARETGASAGRLIDSLRPWAWRFSLALGVATGIAWVWRPTSLAGLLTGGALSALVYGLLMTRNVVEPPLGLYLHPAVARILRRLPLVLRGPLPS
jgi:O-antigen/teichoic acid export membrane protein